MAEKKYKVAVVGGAGVWGRFYLRTYAEHPDCEIVGLVDRARDRRDVFAARHGVSATYDTVEELLAEQVPDIVSAIVPVSQNFPVVTACAAAGVRVVSCEKPISADLAKADELIAFCRERGTLFGCGQAAFSTPFMPKVLEWVREGNIGRITGAAVPNGLPVEMSGGGCVQLAAVRLLTGLEVEWVEGWTLPPVDTYAAPDTPEIEADCPAYGRLGMSGGAVCEILEPGKEQYGPCFISAEGENGRVWLCSPRPVLIQGVGATSTPVHPDFLNESPPGEDIAIPGGGSFFVATIERLMRAFDTGEEPLSSGHDMRQALEIAIAMKLSAHDGHRRVTLPLRDRSHRLLPHPYRLLGGDVAGYKSIGYPGPPTSFPTIASFEALAMLTDDDIQHVLRQVDQKDLSLALLGVGESVRDRILGNMSQRVRTFMLEEVESLRDTTSDEEAERARSGIVDLVRGFQWAS